MSECCHFPGMPLLVAAERREQEEEEVETARAGTVCQRLGAIRVTCPDRDLSEYMACSRSFMLPQSPLSSQARSVLYCAHDQRKAYCLQCSPQGHLKEKIRKSFHRALRHLCLEKRDLTDEIVGCSMQELYNFMMRKVTIWNATYGEATSKKLCVNDMRLDFIKPIKEAKTEEDVIKLHHYSNMQFLWPYAQFSKSLSGKCCCSEVCCKVLQAGDMLGCGVVAAHVSPSALYRLLSVDHQRDSCNNGTAPLLQTVAVDALDWCTSAAQNDRVASESSDCTRLSKKYLAMKPVKKKVE